MESAWILHFTEEVPVSNFREFTVKQMNSQQATKEIRNWTQFEKIHHIYHSLIAIGDQISNAIDAGKTNAQIATLIKQTATESLPAGDELASALGSQDTMTLAEWIEFMNPPDILLEKELCWPVEPDLVY